MRLTISHVFRLRSVWQIEPYGKSVVKNLIPPSFLTTITSPYRVGKREPISNAHAGTGTSSDGCDDQRVARVALDIPNVEIRKELVIKGTHIVFVSFARLRIRHAGLGAVRATQFLLPDC